MYTGNRHCWAGALEKMKRLSQKTERSQPIEKNEEQYLEALQPASQPASQSAASQQDNYPVSQPTSQPDSQPPGPQNFGFIGFPCVLLSLFGFILVFLVLTMVLKAF